jgi:asparagine synthase (glutamine-hydrolysing)
MCGLSGILSYDSSPTRERLKTLLSWCHPFTNEADSAALGQIYEKMNCSVGVKGGQFFIDEELNVACAFTGKLIRRQKIVNLIASKKLPALPNDAANIVAAYATQGIAAATYFDGEFACAILDGKNRELYFLRSRSGGEDLFWTSSQNGLLFSSSLKALLATGQIAPAPDLESLASYLFLGYMSQDKTPIQGVNRVLPGYYIKVSFDGKMVIHSYWSFSAAFAKAKTCGLSSSEEVFQSLAAHVNGAIRARYEQGMPYPAVMDGPIGSKIIGAAFLQATEEPPIPSPLCVFDSLSGPAPAKPTPAMVTITPEKFLKTLIPMVWTAEVPVADINAIPSWHFVALCQKHNLSPFFDSGFDAEFVSYATPRARKERRNSYNPTLSSSIMKKLHEGSHYILNAFFPDLALEALRKAQQSDPHIHYFENHALMPREEFGEASPALGKLFSPDLFLHQFYHLGRITSEPASLFYLAFKTEVIDKLHFLRSKFACSMGMQANAPFVDTELLEFLASLSDPIWASPDILSSFPTHYLSQEVTPPPAPNFDKWFDHPGICSLFRALRGGLLVESGFITHSFLEHSIRMKNTQNFLFLYSLTILELWMRLFIDLPLSKTSGEISLNDLLLISSK